MQEITNRRASEVLKEADEYIVFIFEDEKTLEFTKQSFDDMEVAAKVKADCKPTTYEQNQIVKKYTSKQSFLESLIEEDEGNKNANKSQVPTTKRDFSGELMDNGDTAYGMPIEEFEAKFKKIKKKFKKKREEFEEKAKGALLEAAKLFLGDDHKADYVKYKMELSQRGLGAILYQIYTMEDALHSVAARIKAAGALHSSRDIEVFTGLHRVVLDAQKFQFEYLQSIESSMKDLAKDYAEATHLHPDAKDHHHGKHIGEGGDGVVFYARGPKEFLKQLQEMKSEVTNFKATPSKNINLNPNAEQTEDVVFVEAAKDETGKALPKRNPLTAYEGQPKRQKKEREQDMDDDEESSRPRDNDFDF